MARPSFKHVLEGIKKLVRYSTLQGNVMSVLESQLPLAGSLRAFLPLSLGLPECQAHRYTMHKGEGHF